MEEKSILFVCVENAGRSQMAEAFARKHGLKAQSAGTQPAKEVNPTVVKVMREKAIHLSANGPKVLTPEMIDNASLVVTMGCSVEEVCPRPMIAQMQKKLIDWHLEDPKGKPIEKVREIRDEIESKVEELAKSNQHSLSRVTYVGKPTDCSAGQRQFGGFVGQTNHRITISHSIE